MKAPIILIDGSSYFYRAFHALPPLANSKGQPTGAIYGVVNMVKRLIKDYAPEHIAVVFDAKGKTFRDELYPDYKAHRLSMPDDLGSQFQPLLELLKAMGIPLLIVEGVEADDVIGTLAQHATASGQSLLISTSDKDMAQLVNEHITLINTMTNKILDIPGVKEKFGVTPSQFIDYLTLVGDSSDNIPGVTKCGPKTAQKWLETYQTLDNLILNKEAISGKIGEHFKESLKHLPLSKQLVTIKLDVQLPLALQELKMQAGDKDKLFGLVKELEFKSWLKELLGEKELATAASEECFSPPAYTLITEEQGLDLCLSALLKARLASFEIISCSTDVFSEEVLGIAITINEEVPQSFYVPFRPKTPGALQTTESLFEEAAIPLLSWPFALEKLKPFFEDAGIKKIGRNLKYEYSLLKQQGIRLAGMAFDTTLESYVLDSSTARHDLSSNALKYLGHKTIGLEDICGKGSQKRLLSEVPLEKMAAFLTDTTASALKLHQLLYPKLDPALQTLLETIEMPLISVLADMECHGVLIDKAKLAEHGKRLKERLAVLEKRAFELAGRPFNLSSPKQLQEILFDDLKLPVYSKTPGGQPSTAEAVLQELALDYPLPALILEHRSLSKLLSTYVEVLPKREHPKTGRIHTSYNQAIASTGRLSSSEPNLQNIPIKSEEGRLVRTSFIAPAEHFVLAADYSQIELRIMAHLSKDPGLVKAFENNWDIHTATASEIFNVPREAVSPEQRRGSKAVNFGLIYGMSAFGLARQLGIERADAQYYIDRYFERYPGVLEYMEKTRKSAHEKGYVETIFGRRLLLPEINTKNLTRLRAAERAAINAPMQGSAADIIKKAMLAIAEWIREENTQKIAMIMQVHDELVFEVHKDYLEEGQAKIKHFMENTCILSVPLEVSMGAGLNWDEAH